MGQVLDGFVRTPEEFIEAVSTLALGRYLIIIQDVEEHYGIVVNVEIDADNVSLTETEYDHLNHEMVCKTDKYLTAYPLDGTGV